MAHSGGAWVRVAGVGSNLTQPTPSKYSSGQAWASSARISHSPGEVSDPGRNPTATRAGMSRLRAIRAIVDANCTQ